MTSIVIDNNQDIMDSRDIIARIEELESDRDSLVETIDEAESEVEAITASRVHYVDADHLREITAELDTAKDKLTSAKKDLEDWKDSYDGQELEELTALAEEASSSPDWSYGETLIRDSYFTEYAQELAEDVCEMPKDIKWPYTCIDWDQAASELKMDYMAVDFDGVTYWIRA
jgi:hypothetical protein